MTKGELAESLFRSGLNCSQSVATAFAKEMNLSEETVKRLTLGFGGGMGRMREVCGGVSGMTFVLSAIYGDDDKGKIYERVQEVANEFKRQNGSIICRELLSLNINGADNPKPEERTDTYYKKRPCPELVAMCADILDEYIKNHPV